MTIANVEMQGLEFKITNDSTQAVKSLTSLTQTLKALKTATSGGISGVSKTATQISTLKNALQTLNTGDVAGKLNRIATALKSLNSLGKSNLSGFVNPLQKLPSALKALDGVDFSKFSGTVAELSGALKPLQELGKSNLSGYVNQLKKLPSVMEDLEKIDLNKFEKQMKELASAMAPFANEMQKVSNGFSAFPSRIQKVISSTEQYNATMKKARSYGGLGFLSTGLQAGVAYMAIRRLSGWISSAITASNAYQENLNLFTVAMGEYADQAYEYGQTVSDVLGIDFSEWIRNQGVFNTLLTGFGNTADRAALMSQNLTQLGYDLSSFFNIAVDDAMQKLQSGISGELEPLRRLGFDLSQARLEAVALSLGIDKSVMSMTQAEKAELRYYAIMTQVTTAQGDLARTLESPANQLRILQAQFTMAAQAAGNIFIPALNAILPYAIAVVKVLREVANAVASLFGFELTDVDYSGVADAVGGAADGSGDLSDNLDSAAGAAKELKNYVAGIDELNVLSEQAASGSGSGADAGAGSGFDFELPEYDFLGDAISTRVDEITKKLEPFLEFIRENGADILDIALDIGKALLAWAIAKKFLTSLGSVIDYFKAGRQELTGWDRLLRGLAGVIVLSVGLDWSYDAGYDIGKGEASLTTYIKAVLGPIAAGIGGALIGSALVPGAGAIPGFLIGVGLGILFEVKGYFEGKEAAVVVNEFAASVTSGKTSIEEFATAAATAFTELSSGATTVAQYGAIIDEQTEKIDSAKQEIELYITKWQTVGTLSAEEIGKIITNLDTLVTASEEKLAAASDALSTTLVQALQDATAETKNTYEGLLEMIFLLEANGNTTVAGWKEELYKAEQALADLDETSDSYQQDSQALLDQIYDLTNKIYGLESASTTSATSFERLADSITGLDFSTLTDPSGTAVTALEELSSAAATAYEDTREAYETNIASLDELFAYVDTNSASWKAIYQNALDLGLDESTLITDTDAIKEFMAGYFTEIYEAQVEELDKLFEESYGTIAQYLTDAINAAAEQTGKGELALKDKYWWAQYLYGENYENIRTPEIDAEIARNIEESWQDAVTEAAKTLSSDDTFSPLFDALEESASAVESSRALAVSGTTMGEAITGGVSEGLTSPEAKGLLNAGFGSLAALVDEYGMSAIDAHSPAKLTIPHGEYLTAGMAQGLTDDVSQATLETAMTELATLISTTIDTALGIGSDNPLAAVKGQTFTSDLAKGITDGTPEVDTSLKNMLNKMLDRIQTFVDNSRTAFNNLLRSYAVAMESVSVGESGLVSYTSIPYITVPKMATGGFVDQGQLFIAREAGAEMVGSIGRKTAVANNDQIVEGITAGVTVANDPVVAAIYALMGVVEDKDFSVNIGDDEIGRSYDRYSTRRGERVNRGAFANAY